MAKGKKNRVKNPVSVKKPDQKKETVTTIQKGLVAEQFQGPIPPPQILAGYEQFCQAPLTESFAWRSKKQRIAKQWKRKRLMPK